MHHWKDTLSATRKEAAALKKFHRRILGEGKFEEELKGYQGCSHSLLHEDTAFPAQRGRLQDDCRQERAFRLRVVMKCGWKSQAHKLYFMMLLILKCNALLGVQVGLGK